MFKSGDGGASWIPANRGLNNARVNAVLVDPVHSDIVYAASDKLGVHRSVDGGTTWAVGNPGFEREYASVTALVADPTTDPATIYATLWTGFDTGSIGTSRDGAQSWTITSTGLAGTLVDVLAIDLLDPPTLYVGSSVGISGIGVLRSTDGARTWVPSLRDNAALALAVDPTRNGTVYAGLDGVWKSIDSGTTWTGPGARLDDTFVGSLAIDPSDPETLYAGSSGHNAGVFKSRDAGKSWTAMNAGLANTRVQALVVDPLRPRTLYAGTDGGGIFRSDDGALSWTPINAELGDLRVLALAIDASAPATLYAGTETRGVFRIDQTLPEPTATAIPTRASEGDSCHIVPEPTRPTALALFLPALVLVALRRHRPSLHTAIASRRSPPLQDQPRRK